MRRTISASEGSSIYITGICAGSIFSLFLSLALKNVNGSFDGMSVYSWCGYALMQVAFIATVFIYSAARKTDVVSVAKMKKPLNVKQILLLPFISIATILAFLPLANAWSAFLQVIGYHGAGVAMPVFSNVGVYFLALFLMALLPAFGEELLVRGNLFSGLATRNVWFGVLMSALMFSLMHANPVQTVHQFGLGIVLALVVALSGSLWAGVTVHFFNNFVSITLTAYLPQVDEIYAKLGYFNWLTGAASVIVGVLLLVVLLWLFYRAGGKKNNRGIVQNVYTEDGFTIVATQNATTEPSAKPKKNNIFKDFGKFFKSLFTKQGWKKITYRLEERNEVEYIGKNQNMTGVWIALALVVVYWIYAFVVSIV